MKISSCRPSQLQPAWVLPGLPPCNPWLPCHPARQTKYDLLPPMLARIGNVTSDKLRRPRTQSHLPEAATTTTTTTSNTAVAVPDDSLATMSSFDQHLTLTLQHTFEWIYLVLLLLALLYFLYRRLRKWMRQREAKQKASQSNAPGSLGGLNRGNSVVCVMEIENFPLAVSATARTTAQNSPATRKL